MASYASNYLQDSMAALITGIDTWVGLFTSAPTNAGGGTEVSGNGYARVKISAGGWTASGHSPKTIKNTAVVTFPTDTPSNWGTVTSWGVFDASTSGNMLLWNTLNPSTPVSAGMTEQINALTLEIDFGS